MSGSRPLFMSWLLPLGLVIIGSAVFDLAALPGWIGADPDRVTPLLWLGAVAVVAKLWLAFRGLRLTSARWYGPYLAAWSAGVACLIGLGGTVVEIGGRERSGGGQLWIAVVLGAVLVMPIARVAWAPWFLGRNRHQR
jgi:hypothetical protein